MEITDLSSDLVRLILEDYFIDPGTSRKQQLDLMVLGKDVYAWLAPLFYRYVVLDSTSGFLPEATAIRNFLALPPHSLALVKSVCTICTTDPPGILEACPNIYQLAVGDYFNLGEDYKRLFGMHCKNLRRLFVSFVALGDGPAWTCTQLQSPLFATLTHLDLRVYDKAGDTWRNTFVGVTYLRELVNLTHWAMDLKSDYEMIFLPEVVDLLIPQLPPNLLVLIVGYEPEDQKISETWIEKGCDPRVVFRVDNVSSSPVSEKLGQYDMVLCVSGAESRQWDDWRDPMLDDSECDIWAAAEQLVKWRLGRLSVSA